MAYTFLSTTANSANANTISFTAVAGSTIVLGSQTNAGGGSPTWTVADDANSTWVVPNALVTGAGLFNNSAYCLSCNAFTVITVTYNGGNPTSIGLRILVYSGLGQYVGSQPFQQQQNPGTATDALNGGTVNATLVPAALIGISFDGGGQPMTAGTGFSQRSNASQAGVTTLYEDKRITAPGNVAATGTSGSDGGAATFATQTLVFAEPLPLLGQILT